VCEAHIYGITYRTLTFQTAYITRQRMYDDNISPDFILVTLYDKYIFRDSSAKNG